MTVLATIQDVMSGAKLERPGLAKVRSLIARGEIDALIVYDSDRFTRSVAHSLLLRDELKSAGVALHCVTKGQASADTPEGGLMETIEAAFSEYERLKIRERTQRGKRAKAEGGTHTGCGGRAPYGYRFEGEKRERRLVVVEEEALVVRHIFRWFIDDIGTSEIARRLTRQNIATPAEVRGSTVAKRPRRLPSGRWVLSTLYKILKNSTYAGQFVAFQKSSSPVAVAAPAIIDADTWHQASARLNMGSKLAKRNNTKVEYLLRCRIACGCGCGYRMTGQARRRDATNYRYYKSNAMGFNSARQCRTLRFDAERVEERVWAWIATEILNREYLLEAITTHHSEADDQRSQMDTERSRYYERKVEIQAELSRFYDRYGKGKLTEEELDALETPRKSVIRSIDEALVKLEERMASLTLSPNDVAELLHAADAFRTAPDKGPGFAAKQRVIDLLDVQVVLYRTETGEEYADATVRLSSSIRRITLNPHFVDNVENSA
jgi:site-specific DNA recombinase